MEFKPVLLVALLVALGFFPKFGFAQAEDPTAPAANFGQDMTMQPGEMDFDMDVDEFDNFGEEGFAPDTMDPEAAAAAGAMMLVLSVVGILFFLVGLAFAVFMAYQLSSSLSAIPEQYRELSPVVPWLIFIPLVGIVFQFLSFIKVPRSLCSYLNSVGDSSQGDCGEKLGLWGLVLCVIGCTAPIGLVLVVMSTLNIMRAKKIAQAASGLT